MISEIFDIVNKARSKKDSLLQFGMMIVTDEVISIETKNLTFGVRGKFPKVEFPNLENGVYVLDVEKLARLFKLMPDGIISGTPEKITFKSGKNKIQLSVIDESAFTSYFTNWEDNGGSNLVPYEELKNALVPSSRYTMDQEANSVMTGILVADETIYSTNKTVLSRFQTESMVGDYVIPSSIVDCLFSLSNADYVRLYEQQGNRVKFDISLDNYSIEYIYGVYTMPYPDKLYQLFNNVPRKRITLNATEFKFAFKVLLAASQPNYALFVMNGNQVVLHAEGEEGESDCRVSYSGMDFEPIAFNTNILKSLLSSITGEEITIYLNSATEYTLWQMSEAHSLIVMPIMVK